MSALHIQCTTCESTDWGIYIYRLILVDIAGYIWRHVCQSKTTLACIISSKSGHQLWVYIHIVSTAGVYGTICVSYRQWGCVCSSSGGCSVCPPHCSDPVQPAGLHWLSPVISGLPAWKSSLQPDRTASAEPGQCGGLLDPLENSRGRQRHTDQQQDSNHACVKYLNKNCENASNHSEKQQFNSSYFGWIKYTVSCSKKCT